jgi:2-dehydropantoate 2-reductase
MQRLGRFTAPGDVLWVASKAAQLVAALELAPADRVGHAAVVPLLNGVDHVAVLRARYDRVLAAVIYVESERLEPGLVRQPTPFARVVVGPGSRQEVIADELRGAGFEVALASDEPTLLWEKLALLAPLALTTTARGAPVGVVQADPDWNARLVGCHDEAAAVAIAEGAKLDPPKLRRALLGFSGAEMRNRQVRRRHRRKVPCSPSRGDELHRNRRTHSHLALERLAARSRSLACGLTVRRPRPRPTATRKPASRRVEKPRTSL